MTSADILIFGAGINQLTLIRAARALGLRTVVLDPQESPPGKPLADFYYSVPGNDYETTRYIARRHQVKGIVTSQMEKPMRLMAKLAAEMGFLFHSPEVTERSLDKWLMKQAFLQHGVPCAKGTLLSGDDPCPTAEALSLSFPLIIKPKDATSSQGVLLINSEEELERYYPLTRSYSKTGEVIVEDFLKGPEYSVEAITFEGRTTVVQVTEKFVTPFPHTVEMGHLQPAGITQGQWTRVEEVVTKAIRAIGIDNSASHAEVKLTAEGPKLIEIGARLGGDFISSYLTSTSCGVDLDKAAIQVALGRAPDLEEHWKKYAYIRYFSLPVGRELLRVSGWETVLERPEVVFAHLSIQPGDVVPTIIESKSRPGFVIVSGDSREEVIALAAQAVDHLTSHIVFGAKAAL